MTPLERLRADQHNDLRLASDHALEAFLAERDLNDVVNDLTPHTAIERRHLAHVRSTAA